MIMQFINKIKTMKTRVHIDPCVKQYNKKFIYTLPHELPQINYNYSIGHGAYGKIYMTSNGEVFKKINIPDKSQGIAFDDSFVREIILIETLKNCKHVIKMNKTIMMSHIQGYTMKKADASLAEYMKHNIMSETNCKILLYQLISSVAYAQTRAIMHRDIKPANILINFDNDKIDSLLIDWGMGIFNYTLSFVHDKTKIQTIWYRAPEVLLDYKFNCDNMDMWSIGTIAFELVIGSTGLFNATKTNDVLLKILSLIGTPKDNNYIQMLLQKTPYFHRFIDVHRNTTIENCDFYSKIQNVKLADFITKILVWKPEDRLTPMQALNHPYFADIHNVDNINKLLNIRQDEPPIFYNISNVPELPLIGVMPQYYADIRESLLYDYEIVCYVFNYTMSEMSLMVKYTDMIMIDADMREYILKCYVKNSDYVSFFVLLTFAMLNICGGLRTNALMALYSLSNVINKHSKTKLEPAFYNRQTKMMSLYSNADLETLTIMIIDNIGQNTIIRTPALYKTLFHELLDYSTLNFHIDFCICVTLFDIDLIDANSKVIYGSIVKALHLTHTYNNNKLINNMCSIFDEYDEDIVVNLSEQIRCNMNI